MLVCFLLCASIKSQNDVENWIYEDCLNSVSNGEGAMYNSDGTIQMEILPDGSWCSFTHGNGLKNGICITVDCYLNNENVEHKIKKTK